MDCRLSVIIPNKNGEKTIGLCLEALFQSEHDSFEVIVVDDSSTDNSINIVENFPCKLVKLRQHVGAATARNVGAHNSRGGILFFTDADCLVSGDTLNRVESLAEAQNSDTIIGGTYTLHPYDQSFYSTFQSVFIHYCELKNIHKPDYVAAHAMVMSSRVFHQSGGFPADFFPIIEDVEFSHRLRRKGFRLIMMPDLQVQHIFGYRSLADSMRNGYFKSKYWTMYSLSNNDLLADSGTASLGLKMNVLSLYSSLALATLYLVIPNVIFIFLLALLFILNLFMNRSLFSLFYRTGATMFLLAASTYYMLIYPFAVGVGAGVGMLSFVIAKFGFNTSLHAAGKTEKTLVRYPAGLQRGSSLLRDK